MGLEKDPGTPPAYHEENHDALPIDEEKQGQMEKAPTTDDPFGNEEGGEVQYRTMNWW